MTISERSLRFVVDKWLTPVPGMRIRVVQFGRVGHDKGPYVHISCGPDRAVRSVRRGHFGEPALQRLAACGDALAKVHEIEPGLAQFRNSSDSSSSR